MKIPPSDATSQYPSVEAVGAIPTTGVTRGRLPADPKKPAFPKLKIPPSDATIQYEEFGGASGWRIGGPGDARRARVRHDLVLVGARRRPSPTDGVGK